ncbi:CRTAC1 family protein [Myxococcota bacterium]|nr:CRTAC1 family protein [Myxococcota bacterium]
MSPGVGAPARCPRLAWGARPAGRARPAGVRAAVRLALPCLLLALPAGCGASGFGSDPLPGDDEVADDDGTPPDDDVAPDDDSDGCAGRVRWDRHDEDVGLTGEQGLGAASPLDAQVGGGIALADFHGDGRLDLFVANVAGPSALYVGLGGGTFAEGAVAAGVDVPEGRSLGASAADYDGDGDLDLLVLRAGGSRLFRNRGSGTFEDVSEAAGIDDGSGRRETSGAFGDYDGDGDLDLLLASYYRGGSLTDIPLGLGEPDGHRLLRNRGDGTFEDAADEAPPGALDGLSLQATWHDLDGDGDLDLLVPNDLGEFTGPALALRNDGPGGGTAGARFTEIGQESGLGFTIFSMNLALGDADSDGDDDALVSSMPGVALLRAEEPWSFFDATAASGLGTLATPERDVAWGALFEDLDADGFDDLLVQFGHLEGIASPDFVNAETQPDALLWGREDGLDPAPWDHDLADGASGRTLAVADVNEDGVADVFMGVMGARPRLYLSRPDCPGGHWLEVAVSLPGTGNVHGVGATVEVSAGGRTRRRTVDGGSRVAMASGPAVARFGLGGVGVADVVEARLPDGTVLRAEAVAVDGKLVLGEEERVRAADP